VRLVLASRSRHKLREFARLLDSIELDELPEDVELPPETGNSFQANARVKAHAAATATGARAIADDSGIEAEALGGAPGIYSARYAGPGATDADNLAKLRAEVPPGSALRYVCAIVVADPSGAEHVVLGTCTGTMAATARGTHGFGYDPVFVPDDGDGKRTMAELSDAEKDAISHRGRAVRALTPWLAGRS
jgi:XTP/dITP diphosphohydrolase